MKPAASTVSTITAMTLRTELCISVQVGRIRPTSKSPKFQPFTAAICAPLLSENLSKKTLSGCGATQLNGLRAECHSTDRMSPLMATGQLLWMSSQRNASLWRLMAMSLFKILKTLISNATRYGSEQARLKLALLPSPFLISSLSRSTA